MNQYIASKLKLLFSKFYTPRYKLDFYKIYKENLFGSQESISGQGSEMQHTLVFKNELIPLLKKKNVKKFLDVPCGDFNWMKLVEFGDIEYIGGDIVKDIVEKNKINFGSPIRSFQHIDVTNSRLPLADLIFCRDCFVHLNYSQIFKALKNIKKSGIKYMMITTFHSHQENKDLLDGIWRPINFQKPPFNFSKPIEFINEKYNEDNGKWADKCMGMWRVGDVI